MKALTIAALSVALLSGVPAAIAQDNMYNMPMDGSMSTKHSYDLNGATPEQIRGALTASVIETGPAYVGAAMLPADIDELQQAIFLTNPARRVVEQAGFEVSDVVGVKIQGSDLRIYIDDNRGQNS